MRQTVSVLAGFLGSSPAVSAPQQEKVISRHKIHIHITVADSGRTEISWIGDGTREISHESKCEAIP